MSARHARLHKRGHSASSTATSPLSPVADHGAFTFDRSYTPKVLEESWIETQHPMPAAPSHQLKIKPYLRKLSSKETNGLDLSRPAAENDLSGLGITEYGAYSRSISDVTFTPVNPRHRHNRSTSSTSQFSTSSAGLQRPTPLPTLRQTPQPYTPPIARSSPPSVLESDHEGDDIMSDDEVRLKQNSYDAARRSGSISSAQGASLRLNTNNSSTRLAGSYSQSSVSLTSPLSPPRARGDTLKSIDTTTSPSSRTSFDQTYRFIRGGRDSPVDPASRAASIRAARAKFEEEQRAKERKYEKVAHKQQERDYRKQLKKEDLQRRKSETIDRTEMTRARTISDDFQEKAPRPSVGGRQYSDHREAHSHSLPKLVTTVDPEKANPFGATPKVTKSRAAKGRWLRFVTWLKTRLLRMSGK
ncbi:D-lactate dehydrogenase [Pyrenophora seminiperda CCB06]|uniref:D-lactate dehydrogenase n=1 Tax=Pyrenophora seminiperda CCB06 TaxID=1302712 RepID=A0A3M7LYS0_9PLEO|nr:D-lactate dehydrogenase [Pyrenophora seminiperda CCB06]